MDKLRFGYIMCYDADINYDANINVPEMKEQEDDI
jgi:hypothetical protein